MWLTLTVYVLLSQTSTASVCFGQAGSSAADIFTGIAVAEDNSIVVSGYTDGSWVGGNAGIVDFVAVKLR